MSHLSDKQTAQVTLLAGRKAGFKARLEVTPVGLLAISVLVSSILVSTRFLVRTAIDSAHD